MKKTWLIILAIVVVVGIFVVGKYNTLVKYDETVKTAWSQVENVYQRRLDLIPNLVNTVKGAAAQESGVLVAVVNARANATKVTVDINDAASLAAYQKVQGEVSSSLSKLLAVVENYPALQSIQAFRDLMTQLEGTENRITVERKNFNDAVNTLNIYIRRFPANIIASLFNFQKAEQFEATTGADVAPTVDFGTTDTIPTEGTDTETVTQ
ncbi:MAG: LemA family protein [candidate division SR1 bacterium]|nr:LemA family protein [candidate division SR1 bacterium]